MIMTIAVITLFIIGVGQKQSFRLYLLVSFACSVSTLESCVGERFSSARSKNPPFGQMLLWKRGQGAQVWRGCLSVCLSLTRSQEVGPITRALQHGPYPGRLMNECREKISGCGRRQEPLELQPTASQHRLLLLMESATTEFCDCRPTFGSHSTFPPSRDSFRLTSSRLSIFPVLVTPQKQ